MGRTDVEEAGLLDARQQALVRPERVAVLAQCVLWRFPARLRPGPAASGMHVAVWIAREADQPATTVQVVKQSAARREDESQRCLQLEVADTDGSTPRPFVVAAADICRSRPQLL